jgi:diguanylate cyclase (GGDEF)-like protein
MEKTNTDQPGRGIWRRDLLYSLALFIVAVAAVGYSINNVGLLSGPDGWVTAGFFITFGLFTITTGFPHPGFGHVSFDRVAQVASILVLGPVDAAWINGLASFIYPWHRLAEGASLRIVVTAALNNAGLMSLTILLCGSLYQYLGGPVPIHGLDLRTGGLLLLLMLSMQFMNDVGMMVLFYMRSLNPSALLNTFTTAVESVSVLIAIVVAIAFTTTDIAYFVLLLVVLSIGMLVLKQYALMRDKLESLVEERTEELRIQTIELEQQATHDQMTGLFNRRYADEFLRRATEAARRGNRDFTIALADIDHFKQINDRYSHATGDEVLQRIADVLAERCRKTDMVARYGGEEFLFCFPDTDVEFADQICKQMRIAVENLDWSDIGALAGNDFKVTISFGIAKHDPESRSTSALDVADKRLYAAKDSGRNRVISRET